MSRGPSENSSVDLLAYERPTPAEALQILEGYGMDACLGRWPFLTANAISKIAEAGRDEQRAKAGIIVRTRRRTTTPELEEAAIADVFALGAVSRAAEKHGLTYTLVLKLLRERGVTDYPRVSGAEKMRLAYQTKRARQVLAAAGISATPPPRNRSRTWKRPHRLQNPSRRAAAALVASRGRDHPGRLEACRPRCRPRRRVRRYADGRAVASAPPWARGSWRAPQASEAGCCRRSRDRSGGAPGQRRGAAGPLVPRGGVIARPGAAADAAGHRPAGRRGSRPGRRARSHG